MTNRRRRLSWFSTNKGDLFLNLARPSVDSAVSTKGRLRCGPTATTRPTTSGAAKPHEASEAEWSDVLAARTRRAEPADVATNYRPDAFDVRRERGPARPGRSARRTPPEDLSLDDVDSADDRQITPPSPPSTRRAHHSRAASENEAAAKLASSGPTRRGQRQLLTFNASC